MTYPTIWQVPHEGCLYEIRSGPPGTPFAKDPSQLAKAPTDLEVMKRNLTHLPFADWCDSCIAHRARQDMHQRDGSSRASGFAYTKASADGQQVKEVESLCTLVMVDSSTGYVGCIPVANKNQFAMMVREVLNFTQVLGHSEVIYRCDNEPSLKQLQDLLVRARQQLGLATCKAAPAAYSHGNSLCENSVQLVRNLACSLMHNVQKRLSTILSSEHGLWTWAMRHAAWLLNRFCPVQGSTPFELVCNKQYRGKLCEFSEPVFAYCKTPFKGNPKWQRMFCVGKVESQDSFILYDGNQVRLSRSIKQIDSDWKLYMGFFLNFRAPTWDFKTGYVDRKD